MGPKKNIFERLGSGTRRAPQQLRPSLDLRDMLAIKKQVHSFESAHGTDHDTSLEDRESSLGTRFPDDEGYHRSRSELAGSPTYMQSQFVGLLDDNREILLGGESFSQTGLSDVGYPDYYKTSRIGSAKSRLGRTPPRRSHSTERTNRRLRRSRSRSPNNKGRRRSSSRRGRSKSPDRRGRIRSPNRRDKHRSPHRRGQPRSPNRRNRSRSPNRRGRSRSPNRRGRSRSPQRRGLSRSPVRRDLSRSPLRRQHERTPTRDLAQSPIPSVSRIESSRLSPEVRHSFPFAMDSSYLTGQELQSHFYDEQSTRARSPMSHAPIYVEDERRHSPMYRSLSPRFERETSPTLARILSPLPLYSNSPNYDRFSSVYSRSPLLTGVSEIRNTLSPPRSVEADRDGQPGRARDYRSEKGYSNQDIGGAVESISVRLAAHSDIISHPKDKKGNFKIPCLCCLSTRHEVRSCPKFLQMEKKTRAEIVYQYEGVICYRCLSMGHKVDNCKSTRQCKTFDCGSVKHHTLIHVKKMKRKLKREKKKTAKLIEEHDNKIEELLKAHRRKAEKRIRKRCAICHEGHDIRQCPQVICSICGEGHYCRECPKLFCLRCNCPGHFTNECPVYPGLVCIQCKGEHHIKDCPNKPYCSKCGSNEHSDRTCKACHICLMTGHFAKDCPYKPCEFCKSSDHKSEDCCDKVCHKCQMKGHAGNDCSYISGMRCTGCQGPHHIKFCPDRTCSRCFEKGHYKEICPQAHKGIRCFKCEMFGHHIQQCPFVECKNCGASGHWVRDCTNKRNEFRKNRSNHEEDKNVIKFDYNHIASATTSQMNDSLDFPQVNSDIPYQCKSLYSHFYDSLLAKNRNPDLADQMILYWQLADHDEASLKGLYRRHSSCTRDALRLVFVSELANAPSSSRPMDVTASDLLDDTIEYFMPKLTSDSSMRIAPMFQQQFNLSATPMKYPVTKSQDDFKERHDSLQPLQEFIVRRMKKLSEMFGIDDNYVIEVSTTIQKIMAEVGLGLSTLQSQFNLLGVDLLSQKIDEKVEQANTPLPARVTASYVSQIVTDFLKEFCK